VQHKHPVNQQTLDHRSRIDQAVDRFVGYFGSVPYIVWQTVVIIVWMSANLWLLSHVGAKPFDPYPFILLNLCFSAQASYAAPLILMAQNRAAERDRLEAEHDYRVNEDALSEIRANTSLTKQIHAAIVAVGAPQLAEDLAAITAAASPPDTTTDREAAST
jgi:uncharacterized membrane protein